MKAPVVVLVLAGLMVGLSAAAVAERQRLELRDPDHVNVVYGPHTRNVLDLWLASSDHPTPLLFLIHGGGFRTGDKSDYAKSNAPTIETMLEAGISVAAINYRLTDGGVNPYPAPMLDGTRAVQFLRHHATRFRLDPGRFAATGGSAGGCMLLWIGFHPDLAQPENEDPVLRESSRLQVLAPRSAPSSLHLPTLAEWFGTDSLVEHPATRALFALPEDGELVWTDTLDAQVRDASPITHLTRDDPPVYAAFGMANVPVDENTDPGTWVHHPIMGIRLQEAMHLLGLECHVDYPGGPPTETYKSQEQFIIEMLSKGDPSG
jgi:acetyl esterase/lipase